MKFYVCDLYEMNFQSNDKFQKNIIELKFIK